MKRSIILAISIIALVFCFSSCGEKALDVNYAPHNQKVKIDANIENMVNADDEGGSIPEKIESEEYLTYQKDNVKIADISFDFVQYIDDSSKEIPEIYYRLGSQAAKSQYEKLTKLFNKTYGEYVPKELDQKYETEEMKVKTWGFSLEDGMDMHIMLVFSEGKYLEVAIDPGTVK